MNTVRIDAIIAQGKKLNSDIERISDWKVREVTKLANWANRKNTPSARKWAATKINSATTWADNTIAAKQDELDNLRAEYVLLTSVKSDKVPTQDKPAQTRPYRPAKVKLAPTVDFYDTCNTGF